VGGGNWSGAAVDPDTGFLYVPSRNGFGVDRLAPHPPAPDAEGAQSAAARRRLDVQRAAADEVALDLRAHDGRPRNGPRLVAFDKATGKELASADLPGAAIGTPMTYLLDGKQYIALTVQGATPRDIPELVALALPQ